MKPRILLSCVIFVVLLSSLTYSDVWDITQLGKIDTITFAYRLDINGNYAYIADFWANRIRIVDISNLDKPEVIGFCICPEGACEVIVSKGYAYVADGLGGLRIVDVSSPKKPFEIGFLDTDGYTEGVYVRDNYAYLADRKFVRIVDISNPAKPEEIGFLDSMTNAKQIQVLGDYAYVADGHGGLRIIDVSNPKEPKEAGIVDTPGSGYDVCISGNYAYIADGDGGGLRIIDISDAHNPKEISHSTYSMIKIQVIGKYAYIVGMFSTFVVMDISDPIKPEILKSFYDPPKSLSDVYISSNGYIYMAMRDKGFSIMRFEEWDITSCNNLNNQVTRWGEIKQQQK